MLLGNRFDKQALSMKINDLQHTSDILIQNVTVRIEGISGFNFLGLTIDNHLSWNAHLKIPKMLTQ